MCFEASIGDKLKRARREPLQVMHVLRMLSRHYGLGGGVKISPTEFLSLYGSQSGRGGTASATSSAGIPLELWGQHGDLKLAAAQRCYMKKDVASILSVSLTTMGQQLQRKKEIKMVTKPVKSAQREECTRGCADGLAMWGSNAP